MEDDADPHAAAIIARFKTLPKHSRRAVYVQEE